MFNNLETEKAPAPQIYSKKAIMAFAVFFAPIFGGVLLRQNLIDVGNKPAGNFILTLSIFLSILTMVIVSSLPLEMNLTAPLLNLVWAILLTEYFYKKFFPEANYIYKSVKKALLISFLIILPMIYIVLAGSGV